MKIAVKGLGPASLRDLPEDVISKIDSKLTAGEPAREVAAWMQGEAKVLDRDEARHAEEDA